MGKKINILITGMGSTLGQSIFKALIKYFSPTDISLFLANSEDCAGFYFDNSFIKERFILPLATSPDYIKSLEGIISNHKIDLIFGGTEHEIFKLSSLQAESGYENKVVSQPTSIVQITTDKLETSRFFKRHNITAPSFWLLSDFKEYNEFPVIVKPRISSASRSIEVVREKGQLLKFNPDDLTHYLVQKHIDGEEYTVGCYVDKISNNISSIIMRRQLARDGASIFGEVVDSQAIKDYCVYIMKSLKLEGLIYGPINIQLRVYNDTPYAFEINGRFSSTEAARAKLGFNAVAASVENLYYGREYLRFFPQVSGKFYRFYEEVYSK